MYCNTVYDENQSLKTYQFVGQVFFNSADKFYESIDFKEEIKYVIIDVSRAHFWDISAVYALDKSVIKLKKEGKIVEVIGKNEASQSIIDRFGVHDKPEEIDKVLGGH